MKRKIKLGLLLAAGLLALGAGAGFYQMATAELPRATARPRVAPAFGAPRPAFSACWVEFSRGEVWGQLGTAGFTRADTWRNTASGLLIRHPGGDVLLDAGYSSAALSELDELSFLRRAFSRAALSGNTFQIAAPEAVRRAGGDPARLRWILPTHGHIDHLGGAVDLPGVPVLLAAAEMELAARPEDQSVVVPAHARAIAGRMQPLRFEPRPYEIFDESLDLFGDGAVVVVPLPGHTPGSVAIFVNLGPTRRLLLVGDTVNLAESIDRRVPKSALMRAMTDSDSAAAGAQVARLSLLRELAPELAILPAHDRGAYEAFFGPEPTCAASD